MATLESDIKTLLIPIKDPEQSFNVDIATTLQNFIDSFVSGNIPPNFNSAALLLQGSSSVYSKKVEYLYNLATQLHQCLLRNNKEGQPKKDGKEKGERNAKEKKNIDAFSSVEVRMGKNLSCLRKKVTAKTPATKKVTKRTQPAHSFEFTPVDLIPLEKEEKGNAFYDTRGEIVGCKGEFTINNCLVTESGWLLLPSVSADLIPIESSNPDYTALDLENSHEDNSCHDDSDSEMPQSTPGDEGYPQSSASPSEGTEPPSSQIPSSQSTDEGLGSLPCTPFEENNDQPDEALPSSQDSREMIPESPMEVNGELDMMVELENIPVEDASNAPVPRRSMRNALHPRQIPGEENSEEITPNESEQQARENVLLKKKKIQKKNTRNLPSKLRNSDENNSLKSAPEFCARTFFSLSSRIVNNYISQLDTLCFKSNSEILARVMKILERTKKNNRKKKQKALSSDIQDEDEYVDVELCDENADENGETEQACDAVEGDLALPPLESDDIIIRNDSSMLSLPSSSSPPYEQEMPMVDDDDDSPLFGGGEAPLQAEEDGVSLHSAFDTTFEGVAEEQCKIYEEELRRYVVVTDLSKRVHEWQASMRPFLDKLNQREAFDINQYGSRILNKFEDSNRKQTMLFRNFCKGKEKWEIHRYFMALLPLVNVGNVSIETEKGDNGEEDISMTLLSRKMHHKELEEFGHNDGEHE